MSVPNGCTFSLFLFPRYVLLTLRKRPYYTLLLPLRYPPASNGWRYPLHPAATREVPGVVVGDDGDELTDDEGGGGGFWVDGEEARVVYR